MSWYDNEWGYSQPRRRPDQDDRPPSCSRSAEAGRGLLVLIGLSIPVGAALGVLGLMLDPLYSMLPLTPRDGRNGLEHEQRVPAGRHPAVHHAGRDPAARRLCRTHVRRDEPVAVVAAGRADARQHRRLDAVRRHLWFQRGDRRHRGHGGHPADQALRLQRAAVPGQHRRRRNARHPDPAVDQPGDLRRADQFLGAQALPCRHHSRPSAGRAVHAGDRASPASLKPAWGGQRVRASWGERFASLRAPAAAGGHLPAGGRLDLRRPRDADRSGRARRARRAGAGRRRSAA